ncbi:hypothetical protein [Paenibacillus campi]|uniref:hypothetical protein n=1 Tax=Paenibacillus campi TaxID=3106031 RepID=UPI002AFF5FDA|nr:hypothetical protein [Paenibacillus sp. SGZ-1009]
MKSFLESLGLEVRKIPENSLKTTDYEVYQNGELVFYCEEKTLEYDDFEGLKHDSTYSSISTHVHKAVKQFKSTNPNRVIPNVLAFVNFDSSRDAHDLFITLTGYAKLDNGRYMKIHNVGRVFNDLNYIDLYLWFDKEVFKHKIWGGVHKEHYRKLNEIMRF